MTLVITQALKPYGANLSPDGLIQRGGKTLPVAVSIRKNRIRFISTSGNLLASGPLEANTVEKFVEGFWFWTKA